MDLMNHVLYLGSIFVATTISLFLISKGLKFKKQNLMPAALVVAVIMVVDELGPYVLIGSELFSVVFILVGILSIKYLYKEGWIETIVAFVITVIVIGLMDFVEFALTSGHSGGNVLLMFSGIIFLVMVFSMWIASKTLKFKKQNLLPAVFVAVVNMGTQILIANWGYLITRYYDSATYYDSWNDFGLAATDMLFFIVWFLSIKQVYKEGWVKTLAAFVIAWAITSAVRLFVSPPLMTL